MNLGALSLLFGAKSPVDRQLKPSVFKDLFENPDDFKLEISIENGDIVARVSKKSRAVAKKTRPVMEEVRKQ